MVSELIAFFLDQHPAFHLLPTVFADPPDAASSSASPFVPLLQSYRTGKLLTFDCHHPRHNRLLRWKLTPAIKETMNIQVEKNC
ncbi:hypothetical protein EJB05_52110, partial [Eragrostis curvula]